MLQGGTVKYRAFWINDSGNLEVIDQRKLPHEKIILELKNAEEAEHAISDMVIRGAGTIGCVAAFGVYLAARDCKGDKNCLAKKAAMIRASRPTAMNLMWAVDRMMEVLSHSSPEKMVQEALEEAVRISDEDVERSGRIGRFGFEIMEKIAKEKGKDTIHVLTHCNAGWLGIADSGSALAPIYEAHRNGMKVHVWVDETRPRNQGSTLTAWELAEAGVDHTVIVDNAGGHLMMNNEVDIVFVGSDRVVSNGDVANKIGTYLKALAAKDNDVPFYVCLPVNTFDFVSRTGSEIEIENRSEREVTHVFGKDELGKVVEVQIPPDGSPALNPAFDVTPGRLVTGLITERGVCQANEQAIMELYADLIEVAREKAEQ